MMRAQAALRRQAALDAIKLAMNPRAWLRGERDRMHVVHAPSLQSESSRHLMRDRGQLQKEVLSHQDCMRKLVVCLPAPVRRRIDVRCSSRASNVWGRPSRLGPLTAEAGNPA